MTDDQERDCLSHNPFEGDFGAPGDRILKDKIGTARKAGAVTRAALQREQHE